MNIVEKCGNRIMEIRVENRLSQEEFSKRVGITRNTLSNYERGVRSADITTLCAICDEFDVSIDYLLGRTNEKSTNVTIQAMSKELGLTDKAIKALAEFNKKHSPGSAVGTECEVLEELITNNCIFEACEMTVKHANADYFNSIDNQINKLEKEIKAKIKIGENFVNLKKLQEKKEEQENLKQYEIWKIIKKIENGINEALEMLSLCYNSKEK